MWLVTNIKTARDSLPALCLLWAARDELHHALGYSMHDGQLVAVVPNGESAAGAAQCSHGGCVQERAQIEEEVIAQANQQGAGVGRS